MPTKPVQRGNPEVDDYIERVADFAKPILKRLRAVVHAACPEVEEAMKWRFPNFLYKGMLCNMAAFKNHCSFGFWKGELIFKGGAAVTVPGGKGMGDLGKITRLEDLPKDAVLTRWIKEAMKLNESGAKLPSRSKPREAKEVVVPEFFVAALKKNKKAMAAFENFSPSHRREYCEWLTEAKTEATRLKRLDTALEWLAEGKPRNWKYMNC